MIVAVIKTTTAMVEYDDLDHQWLLMVPPSRLSSDYEINRNAARNTSLTAFRKSIGPNYDPEGAVERPLPALDDFDAGFGALDEDFGRADGLKLFEEDWDSGGGTS